MLYIGETGQVDMRIVDIGVFRLQAVSYTHLAVYKRQEFAHALAEKVLEVQLDWYGYVLDEVGPYLDIVETGDDYGTQHSLMLSPDCLEEFILSLSLIHI